MSKLKVLASVILFTSLISGCSSDPYENAGKCDEPGAAELIKGNFSICTGVNSNTKWYFRGKYFSDTILLAKTKYLSFQFDDKFKERLLTENLSMDDFILVYENSKISSEELAVFAENEPRWDSLLEAKSQLDDSQSEQTYLFRERFSLLEDFRKGKVSQSVAFKAQERQINHLDGELAEATRDYEAKVEVLSASLGSTYSITDKNLLLILLTKYTKESTKN